MRKYVHGPGAERTKIILARHCSTEKFKRARRKRENARYRSDTAFREKLREASRAFGRSERGRQARRKALKKFFAKHPEVKRASLAVSNAIAYGKFPSAKGRPCHFCAGPAVEYHHHRGYSPEHWFDVLPTCKKCHESAHHGT